VLAKNTCKCLACELTAVVSFEDTRRSPHLERFGQDRSACICYFVRYEPTVHDEARGVIKEGHQIKDASASCGFVGNMYLVQISMPQVIHVLRYERVTTNANRPIHRRSQWVQDLVHNVIRGKLAGQRDTLCGVPVTELNTLDLAQFADPQYYPVAIRRR
jgi:hypothetical protein